MHLCFLVSQFKHIPHDCYRPAVLHFMKHIQSGLHGNRVGIVTVVHNGHSLCLYNVTVSSYRFVRLNPCFDLLQRKTKLDTHSRSRQRIGDHMTSRCRYCHRDFSLLCMKHKPAARQSKTLAVLCINRQLGTFLCLIQLTPIRQSIKYRCTDTFVLLQSTQLVIIAV